MVVSRTGYAREASNLGAGACGDSSMRLNSLAARSTDALDGPPTIGIRPSSLRSVASYDTAGMGASAPMDAHATASGYHELHE